MSNSRKDEFNGQNSAHDDQVAAANGFTIYLAIRKLFSSSKNAFQALINSGGGDFKDFFDTFIRWYHQFSSIFASGTNDGSDHKDSHFNKNARVDGIDSPLNAVGQGFFIGSIASLVFGTVKEIYKEARKITLSSYSYLTRQLNKLNAKVDIDKEINRFIGKGTVISRLDEVEMPEMSDGIFDFINLFNGKKHFFKDYKKSEEPSTAAKLVGTVSLFVKSAWNFISNNAFVYWLVWFPFVLAAGTAAASTSMFFVPIILAITFGVGLTFSIWKIVDRIRTINKVKDKNEFSKVEDKAHDRMIKDLRQRVYMRAEHRLTLQALGVAPKVDDHEYENYVTKSKYGQIELTKDALEKDNAVTPVMRAKVREARLAEFLLAERKREIGSKKIQTKLEIENKFKQGVLNGRLAKYLLEGSKRRIGVAVGMEVASGLVMTSMVFWLISTVALVAAGGAITNAAFLFFDSGFNTAIAGGIIGGFFGVKKIAELRKNQRDYEQKVYERLTEAYKPEKFQNVTKEEKFNEMEMLVEFRKTKVALLRLEELIGRLQASSLQAKAIDKANLIAGELAYYKAIAKTNLNFKSAPDIYNGSLDKYKSDFRRLNSVYLDLCKYANKSGIVVNKDIKYTYDLNKIDVHNDYYFEKQKDSPTVFTYVKKALSRGYTFLTGGQSGIFIIRALFLVGGIFAAAATGAPLVFIAIAAVGGLVLGGLKLWQYCLERKRQHKDNFVETIDTRISYLKKKDKELNALENSLNDPNHGKQPEQQAVVQSNDHQAQQANDIIEDVNYVNRAAQANTNQLGDDPAAGVFDKNQDAMIPDATFSQDNNADTVSSSASIISATTKAEEPIYEEVIVNSKPSMFVESVSLWSKSGKLPSVEKSPYQKFNMMSGRCAPQMNEAEQVRFDAENDLLNRSTAA